jgi:mono/diheme cytochrome c family protein
MIRRPGLLFLLLFQAFVLSIPAGIAAPEEKDPTLAFVDARGAVREVGLRALRAACTEARIEVDDPYQKRHVRYVALPLRCVLDLGFQATGGAEGLRGQSLLLRALDGYTRPVSGSELLDPGGYLAFGEVDLMKAGGPPRFSPIDRRAVDPGPFYMVWTGASQNDPHARPWPYQLARIEVAPFEQTFPKTVPRGLDPSDPGWAGYAIFQRACASCHSINGQGGKVGPDLNVPRSIVDYRPIADIRAYIRNPQAFRYTSMPAHPNLSEQDLDDLIAYFVAMSQRKDDPHSGPGS